MTDRQASFTLQPHRKQGKHARKGTIPLLEPALLVRTELPRLRTERGWSQGELAERLKVSRQTVNAIETGKYDPSLPLAFRIARLFRKRIEEIFEPDGD